MPGTLITVSLGEILEVVGQPLREIEVWSILHQSTLYLQQLLRKEEGLVADVSHFLVTPDTLCFLSDGSVEICGALVQPSTSSVFIAPELSGCQEITVDVIDKGFNFSLGRTLLHAVTYGLHVNQRTDLGADLEHVLRHMTNNNFATRMNCEQVLQTCTNLAEKYPCKLQFSSYTQQFYSMVMGNGSSSDEENKTSSSKADRDYEKASHQRKRHSRRSRRKHRRTEDRNRDRSRSRSRSRSASRDRRSKQYDYDDSIAQENAYCLPDDKLPPYTHHIQRFSDMTDQGLSYYLSDITSLTTNQNYDSLPRQMDHSYSSLPRHMDQNFGSPPRHMDQKFGSPPRHMDQNFGSLPRHMDQNFGSLPRHMDHKFNSLTRLRDTPKLHNMNNFETGSYMGQTAYEKYVRLKERQRKLKILRQELLGEQSPMMFGHDFVDHPGADAKSLGSLQGYSHGFYLPGLHMRYGSETALKLRLESDLDSLASSEMSLDRRSRRSRDVQYLSSQQHIPLSERLKKAKDFIANSNNPAKEYYGPEFVHKSSKPIVRVPVPLQGESLRNPSLARRVVVVLLTGQKLEAFVDPSTTGHQMFESIITHVELPEFFFFGLSYLSHGEHFFLEPDLKLHKVSPEGWREGSKSGTAVTFTLYLRVKFYPEDLSLVRHQVTKHQLYLQLRQDIVDESLWCHEEKCVALAGLALQVEYGNYDSESMRDNYFETEHYFPTSIIKDLGAEHLMTKAIGSHVQSALITERQAQLEFVKMAMSLPDYGIHYYKLLKSKQDTSSTVWLGIKLKCMVLSESHTLHRVITQQYPWQAVQKVSFNKRRFSISVKPELGAGQPKKMNYFTSSFRKGSYLLQFLTAQHRFQLSMRARETQLGIEGERVDSFSEAVENCPEEVEEFQIHQDMSESGDQQMLPQYRQPPPYMAPSVSMSDLWEKYTISPTSVKPGPMRRACTTGDIHNDVVMQKSELVEKLGAPSVFLEEHHLTTELGKKSSADRFDILSSEHNGSCTFQVVLEKDRDNGIGITIVGGRSGYGIFVKDVKPHGPADIEGTLRKGDKILAIDNVSMRSMDHAAAVKMIRDSPHQVKLLVSRVNLASSSNQILDRADFLDEIKCDADDNNVHTHSDVYTKSLFNHGQKDVVEENYIKSQNIPDLQTVEQSVVHVRASPYMRETTASTSFSEKDDAGINSMSNPKGSEINEVSVHKDQKKTILSSSTQIEERPVYEVTLSKQDGTFGLNIAGGVNTSVRQGGIYVKSLQRGGAAELDGTIQIGDRILKISGCLLNQCTHKQAVEAIRGAPASCHFVMERSPTSSRESSTSKSPEQEINNQQTTDLHKVIDSKIEQSPATLQESNCSSQDEILTVKRQYSNDSSNMEEGMERNDGKIYYPFVNKENTYSVDLRKGNSGLGFSVYGGVDVDTDEPTQGIVRIKQIFPIGPAASSGKMEQDDVILEVNGKPVKGLTHAETMATLRTTPADVNLMMCRPDPEELSPLFRHSQQSSFPMTPTPTSCIEVSSQSESEEEPILYRDTLPEGGMLITPPTGFSSPPNQHHDGYHYSLSVPPTSTPPPLPTSMPPISPAFSVQSDSVLPGLEKHHLGRWGSFENLKHVVSPRCNFEDDLNSTYETSTDNEGELPRNIQNDLQGLMLGERLTRLSHSDCSGSLSDESSSSTSSVVRSPLKVTGEREDSSSQMTSMCSDITGQRTGVSTADQVLSTQDTELSEEDAPPIDMIDPPAPRVSPVYLQEYHFGADPSIDDINPDVVFLSEVDGNRQQFAETNDMIELHVCEPQGKYLSNQEKKADLREKGEKPIQSESYEEREVGESLYGQRLPDKIVYHNHESFVLHHGENFENETKANNPHEQIESYEDYEDTGSESDQTNSESEFQNMTNRNYLPTVEKSQMQSDNKDSKRQHEHTESEYEQDFPDYEHEQDKLLSEQDHPDYEHEHDKLLSEHDHPDYEHEQDKLLSEHYHPDYDHEQDKLSSEHDHPDYEHEQDKLLFEQDQKIHEQNKMLHGSFKVDTEQTDSDTINKDFAEASKAELMNSVLNNSGSLDSELSDSQFIHDSDENKLYDEFDNGEFLDVREEAYVGGFADNIILRSEENMTENSFNRSHSFGAKDRENKVFTIELKKCSSHGLGLSLVTAEKDNQTGVFVRSIAENGEADRDGRLHVMDRLLKVNEESLIGLSHPKAVQMIRKSKGKVSLTVSRMSSRNLDVITPPVIMTNFEDDSYDVDYTSSNNDDDDYDDDDDDNDDSGNDSGDDRSSLSERKYFLKAAKNEDQNEEEGKHVNEDISDSEEEDMNALVREAEKLLASSEPSECHTDSLTEGVSFDSMTYVDRDKFSHNVEDVDERVSKENDEENNAWSLTAESNTGSYAVGIPQEELGNEPLSMKNQTYTIVPSQRKLDVDIPDMLSTDWLDSLPLLLPAEDVMSKLPGLLSRLQQQVERDDPAEEYKELRNVKGTDECSIAKLPENKPCNRFRNILPYDVNRVELGSNAGYINASHILMNVGECEAHFIVTQGPKLETAEDFWQMIWEQNVSVIAMLTLDVENQKIKCHRYWPDFQEIPMFVCDETMRISLISVEALADIDLRKLLLEDVINNESRIVYHVSLTTWPDHGVPQPVAVLQYIQLVHVYHSTGPIVVHCSAGIGRTGTFITTDLALAQIENNGKCDIYEIVQELRKQRYGMIQTKDQYTLCYLACIEAIRGVLLESSQSGYVLEDA